MKNSGFGTQLRRRRAHRVTHLEEVVALLRASVGQLRMCAAQISLEEKAAFEDPDDPTPSAAAQSGSAGIPASSPLFLGRFWTTGHGRATEQGPPAQCRASRLAEACWAPCRLAWPHSAALQPEASSSLSFLRCQTRIPLCRTPTPVPAPSPLVFIEVSSPDIACTPISVLASASQRA